MAPALVGIMGKKRHGKDTAAAHLVTAHGFTRYAFADALREHLYRLNPYLPPIPHPGSRAPYGPVRLRNLVDSIGWDKAKTMDPEVRRLLQEYGMGIREEVPDFWIDRTFRAVDATPGPVVLSDVRFPNEADAVRHRGGILVYVANPRVVDDGDRHPSEILLTGADADITVWNDREVEYLHCQMSDIVR